MGGELDGAEHNRVLLFAEVSPVSVSWSSRRAHIAGVHHSRRFLYLALYGVSWPILSTLFRVEFSTVLLEANLPEYTLNSVSFPT